jgi:hypothetical protein
MVCLHRKNVSGSAERIALPLAVVNPQNAKQEAPKKRGPYKKKAA